MSPFVLVLIGVGLLLVGSLLWGMLAVSANVSRKE
jgi:hypothetical protein